MDADPPDRGGDPRRVRVAGAGGDVPLWRGERRGQRGWACRDGGSRRGTCRVLGDVLLLSSKTRVSAMHAVLTATAVTLPIALIAALLRITLGMGF